MSPPVEKSPKGHAVRKTAGVFLIAVAFVLLLRFHGATFHYFVHTGINGLADITILALAVAIAYALFFAIIRSCFVTCRPLVCHGFAGGLSLLWLAMALLMSTTTEVGLAWLLEMPVV